MIEKLTYANVVATIALFVALGGSSYAALHLTGQGHSRRLAHRRDLKRNSLGGKRIKESRLGSVPSARNAERLDGITAGRLLCVPGRNRPGFRHVRRNDRRERAAAYGIAAGVCEGTDRARPPAVACPATTSS